MVLTYKITTTAGHASILHRAMYGLQPDRTFTTDAARMSIKINCPCHVRGTQQITMGTKIAMDIRIGEIRDTTMDTCDG